MLSRKVIAKALVSGQRAYKKVGFGYHEFSFPVQPEGPAKYDTRYERLQKDIKKDIEYESLLAKEVDLIAQLEKEGRVQDYNPSLEPNTINLKAVEVPYYSPQLRAQTPEQTAAAKANTASWQSRLDNCAPEDRVALVEELHATEKLVVWMWDKEYKAKWRWESDMVENLRYNGIVPGVEGYVNIKHWGNEELMEEIVEMSGVTEFPQVFGGGKSLGSWRKMAKMFNTGELVQVLESIGLQSKMKGTYYYENIALIKH